MMMDFQFSQGELPLLVSMPHVGTDIPDDIAATMTPAARVKTDTDWHLVRLYDFLREMGVSVLSARWSRYVIDLNRPPENTNLYPGQDTTGLCPVDTFGREPLYLDGRTPDEAEVRRRLALYWQPYHAQLRGELARLKALHGRVALWDAHSIASHVPRFFDGKLPDLNFGTADGASCDAGMTDAIVSVARRHGGYTVAVNGRFKGGHITRHYGKPQENVHAIQLEMCQSTYMDESAPYAYREDLARNVQPVLKELVAACAGWAGGGAGAQ
jgi:N-formylglutamate deformylase